MFANCATDKVLIPRIYKGLKKFNVNTADNPVKKWTKDGILMPNRHKDKHCSGPLAFK